MSFEPTYAGRTGAEVVVSMVAGQPYGKLLTYEAIASELGVASSERRRVQAAARAAQKQLQTWHSRSLVGVRGTGYRILFPGEHAQQGARYQEQSRRRIQAAIQVLRAADERDMTTAEAKRNQALLDLFVIQDARLSDVELRMARLEALVLS